MPIVKCNVANCAYWEQGNNCSADSILVEVDKHANKDYQITNGELVGSADHQDESSSNAGTCCHTFRQRH
jgi:hypothetical protein